MERARLGITYYFKDYNDLIVTGEWITIIGKTLERIKKEYDVEVRTHFGEVLVPSIYIHLAQEPQILKSALEDLVNSQEGLPDEVHSVNAIFGREKREEELGIKIAREVLDSAGYLLKPNTPFPFLTIHYNVKKKV